MMTIGETIRKLRRERDITQEGLAEMLGVTSQSVSQWETGRTAPDISQLAPLAHIFEVSADVLLGIDVEKKQSRILELYAEAYDVAASGAHVRAISMTEEALRLYPNSHRLMDFYANEIYLYSHMLPEDVREEHTERAFGYLDRILAECTDPDIRNNSLIMACPGHPGRYVSVVTALFPTDGTSGADCLDTTFRSEMPSSTAYAIDTTPVEFVITIR